MTDQELKDLVAGLAVSQAERAREFDRQTQEMRAAQAEADAQLRATQAETSAQIRAAQVETSVQIRAAQTATDRQIEKTDRQIEKTQEELQSLARQATRTQREVGGLANEFGGFTEGLAWPSLVKIFEDLDLDVSAPRIRARHNGESIELDAFAYSNGGVNLALVAEVKSRFREEHLARMKEKLEDFPKFFPMHKDKELRGLIAAVDIPEDLARRVLRAGIYLARVHDDTFVLVQDESFKPRSFNA